MERLRDIRIKHILRSNSGIIAITLLYVLLFTFNLDKFPDVKMDEAWFSNPAYELASNGRLGTTMLQGWHNIENYTYWQPPAYLLQLAASFKLFGFGVTQARIVSVALGLVGVIFTYLLAKELYDKRIATLATLLLSSNPLYFAMSRLVRMEIAVTTFMIIALYLLVIAIRDPKPHKYFLCGVFAMLAMLSHPNGLLGIAAIYFIVLILGVSRSDSAIGRLRSVFTERGVYLYCAGLAFTMVPYLIYISLDFQSFLAQFMSNIGQSLSSLVGNILAEPSRYSSFLEQFTSSSTGIVRLLGLLAVLLLISLTILTLYRVMRNRNWGDKIILIFLLTHVILFTVIVSNKTDIYLTLLLPAWSIIVSATIFHVLFKKKVIPLRSLSIVPLFVGILLAGHILANYGAISYAIYMNRDYNYDQIKEEVLKYVPKGSTIIGETTFWIALHDEFKYYDWHVFSLVGGERFHEVIEDLQPEFILFDESWATGRYGKHTAWEYMIQSERFIEQNCTQIGVIPKDKDIPLSPITIYRVNKIE